MTARQECTFRPEQMSAHKAARGRALAMSGLRDDVSADSSSASALTPDPDNHKYLVRLLRLFTPLWYHQAWGCCHFPAIVPACTSMRRGFCDSHSLFLHGAASGAPWHYSSPTLAWGLGKGPLQ